MEGISHRVRRLNDLNEVASSLLRAAGGPRVVAFYGEMGVGKTTLIQQVCKKLGVSTEVTSPTFALVNEYPSSGGPVYHFDFYRINQVTEALDFGIEEYFDSGNWCFLEWPEKLEELLPEGIMKVFMTLETGGKRLVRMEIPD
jgi:tRNA threonylcarbamoyladenosine biosynthesis protein TsaE